MDHCEAIFGACKLSTMFGELFMCWRVIYVSCLVSVICYIKYS